MMTVKQAEQSERTEWGTWECSGITGEIYQVRDGWIADSPSVIGAGSPVASPEHAAEAAYRREATLGSVLGDVVSRYRIEHPGVEVSAYAVHGNDPWCSAPGEPAEGGRYSNLMPWEREMVKTARVNQSMHVMLRVGETVVSAAVANRHVVIVRTESGLETGRWRVLDGCRKVALFLV